MDSFTMVKVRLKIKEIERLRDAIEKEKIAHKNCILRRKSTAKCSHHIKDIKWAKSEIKELRDQVKVLYTKIGD